MRLDHDERAGLALLERAIALDPEATTPACEHAHAFLLKHREKQAAEPWAERWRRRDELETLRHQQLETIDTRHELAPHGLPLWIPFADRKVTFERHFHRIENYHHPRHLMMNILALERMQGR